MEMILARSDNGVIGREGGLPWRLREDLKRFKEVTMGRVLMMGRRTWDSLPEHKLPGRYCIVLSQRNHLQPTDNMISVATIAQAQTAAQDLQKKNNIKGKPIVAGGGEIYRLFEDQVSKIYLTLIRKRIEGDAIFNLTNEDDWEESYRFDHPEDDRNDHPFTFLTLRRRSSIN